MRELRIEGVAFHDDRNLNGVAVFGDLGLVSTSRLGWEAGVGWLSQFADGGRRSFFPTFEWRYGRRLCGE